MHPLIRTGVSSHPYYICTMYSNTLSDDFLYICFVCFFVSFFLCKGQNYDLKIPDIEKSLALVKNLQSKKEGGESVTTRYNLADNVYGKAEVDTSIGIVNLWLGANVMLEYTYDEAADFLTQNLESARKEFISVKDDLGFVRDQIVTSEVSMTRIFNWDVRRKRAEGTVDTPSS